MSFGIDPRKRNMAYIQFSPAVVHDGSCRVGAAQRARPVGSARPQWLGIALSALMSTGCASGPPSGQPGTSQSDLSKIGAPSPGHEIKAPNFLDTIKEGLGGSPYKLTPNDAPKAPKGANVKQFCVDATYDYANERLKNIAAHPGFGQGLNMSSEDFYKQCMKSNGQPL